MNKWLQSQLTAHGFPVGVIDGKIGPITIAAMKAFQRKNQLKVTGVADDATMRVLRTLPTGTATAKELAEIPDRDAPNPSVLASPFPFPSQNDMARYYGKPGTNMAQIKLPYPMRLAWDKRTVITKMTLHKRCADSAQRVLNRVALIYTPADRAALGLDLFGGSLNIRKMRGGTRLSTHAYGAAIDFDPERNQLSWHKPRARLSHPDALPFWHEWEKEGWLSLGRARDFDWMHVQAARL